MPLFRRPLAFSLRTMMVLVTAACLVFGWLGWERHRATARAATRVSFKSKATFIAFHAHYRPSTPRLLLWLRRRFGDEPVLRIHLDRDEWTDTDVQRALRLFPEATVIREMPKLAPPFPRLERTR